MKLGLLKALIIGLGITFISSGMAFAGTEEIQPAAGIAQDSIHMRGQGSTPNVVVPAKPILSDDGNSAWVSYEIDPELAKKQNEIDIFFKEHFAEIREKGFTFTHTSPRDGVIEIGITPYSEDAANYLYEIFGKAVIVVEGKLAVLVGAEPALPYGAEPTSAPDYRVNTGTAQESETMDIQIMNAEDGVTSDADLAATTGISDASGASDNSKIRTLAAHAESADDKAGSTVPMMAVYSLGALVFLGGTALVLKKKVASVKK